MKKYKDPAIEINKFSRESIVTTISSVFQSWGEESSSRTTGVIDWSTSRASDMSF